MRLPATTVFRPRTACTTSWTMRSTDSAAPPTVTICGKRAARNGQSCAARYAKTKNASSTMAMTHSPSLGRVTSGLLSAA